VVEGRVRSGSLETLFRGLKCPKDQICRRQNHDRTQRRDHSWRLGTVRLSKKTTDARTLIGYLGGEDEVTFISDRVLLASQVVNHILELEDSEVKHSIADDGRQRIEGAHATVWLGPGEGLETVHLDALLFDLHIDVPDNVVPEGYDWFDRGTVGLGHQIREKAADGKPIVIEAGFGTDAEPTGESPLCHTISDLFTSLEEGGAEPKQVKWIIVEAGYDKRSERNRKRRDSVPAVEFDRFAVDGGDLDPDHQSRLEEQGTVFRRVPNDHDDIERFRADIIAAFEEMFGGA
jgi:hypothetical protein